MWTKRESSRSLAFLLSSVDRLGRVIDSSVLSAAQEIAACAVSYGERLLGDPALALTLFEEAAATVSITLRRKEATSQPQIREMRRYLFRAYLRHVGTQSPTGRGRGATLPRNLETRNSDDESTKLERRILVRELLDGCDRVTKEIVIRRLEGCSWKEIEKTCNIPANAANLRFSKALKNFQKLLRTRGRFREEVLGRCHRDAKEEKSPGESPGQRRPYSGI